MSDSPQAATGTPSAGEACVALAEVRLATAWNVRGDPAQAAFVAEAERSLGVPLPSQLNTCARSATAVLLWLGPHAWLFVAGADSPRGDFDEMRRRLGDAGGALFDVSASYAMWLVSGAAAPRVLNKGCPLDLHPHAFPAGHCAQSLLGHIDAVFYRSDDASTFIVMVARSFAADAWDFLTASAAADGYRIAPPVSFGAA